MKTKIQAELKNLEQRRDIKILYAVESGSRAWGFESVNSDWDVRFIYVHKPDWYMSIDDKKETIEEMLPDDLDLSGWELRKALKLFRKSNPPLMEWLRSPLVYQEAFSTAAELKILSEEYFNPKACLHHYFHMGEGNYKDYLQGEMVKMKKYFYVLRPLLCCGWIEKYNSFPPMEFDLLVEDLVEDDKVKMEIETLLVKKKSGEEMGVEPRVEILHQYIISLIEHFREYLKKDIIVGKTDTEKLNLVFRRAIKTVWSMERE
jgi:predicted nucleotidyltransferase